MIPVKRVRTAIFLLIAATFPAAAQEAATPPAPAATPATTAPAETPALPSAPAAAPTAAVTSPTSAAVAAEVSAAPGEDHTPWRGSSLSYGHAATAYTFNKGAERHYNPTWVHHLLIRPEWHFGPQLYLRGSLEVGQELTLSDETTRRNEVVWGEPWLEVGVAGWKDPFAKVKVAGSVRLMGGFSKASWAETRIFSIGPGISLSRAFPVLAGLSVRYDARLTQRFHRTTTGQQESSDVAAFCFDVDDIQCGIHRQEPHFNTHTDITHGPTVTFQPHEKVTLLGSFTMYRGWLYTPSTTDPFPSLYNPQQNPGTRDAWGFTLGAAYQFLPELSATFGSATFAAQRDGQSQLQSPFFNRYTQLYLDLGLDVEALLKRI